MEEIDTVAQVLKNGFLGYNVSQLELYPVGHMPNPKLLKD